MYLYQLNNPGPIYLLKFAYCFIYNEYFQAPYDPDIPCIYLSVFAHLNQVALSDGSFRETKLNNVP